MAKSGSGLKCAGDGCPLKSVRCASRNVIDTILRALCTVLADPTQTPQLRRNGTVCNVSGCVESVWLIQIASHWSKVPWPHIVTTTASFLILCSLYPSTTAALTKVVLLCALRHLSGMVRPRITDTAISIKSFHPPQAPRIALCALPTLSYTHFS